MTPVLTVFADVIGILNGDFEGWFSTDNRRVPLAARMKVFVGSVYIELEKWVKWTP